MITSRRPLLHRLSRELTNLAAAWAGEPPASALSELAAQLLSSDLTVLGYRSPDQRHMIQWWPRAFDLPRHDSVYESLVHEHPVRNRFRASGEAGPHVLSDVITLGAFKNSGLYQDYFRHFGITRLMAIYAPLVPGAHLSLGVSRGGRDFSREERLAFALLQPQLVAAVKRERARLSVSTAPQSSSNAVVWSVLSAREREVLRWVAEGKTNPEIAIILGVSRLTVKTHVETILRKLSVENRLAAAALVRASEEWRARAGGEDPSSGEIVTFRRIR